MYASYGGRTAAAARKYLAEHPVVEQDNQETRRTVLRRELIDELVAIRRAKLAAQAAEEARVRREAIDELKSRGMPGWAVMIFEDCASEIGVSLRVLLKSRAYVVVRARSKALYLIKAARRSLSSPTIARWFAREHTGVQHAIVSYAEANGLDPIYNYNIKLARSRNSEKTKRHRARMAAKKASA